MWKRLKIGKIISWALIGSGIIGLVNLPENIDKIINIIFYLSMITTISQNLLQWVFLIGGLIMILICSDKYKITWSLIKQYRFLLIITLIIGIAIGSLVTQPYNKQIIAPKNTDWSSIIKKPIIGKTFQNERVELDGFSYHNCKFINVTFVYKGIAPFDMVDIEFIGVQKFDTTSSRPISGMIKLLDVMGHLKNLKFNQVDPTKND